MIGPMIFGPALGSPPCSHPNRSNASGVGATSLYPTIRRHDPSSPAHRTHQAATAT